MVDNLQFYPTPLPLATKAWRLFKNRNFVRVLEPSAGEGHLARVETQTEIDGRFYNNRTKPVDCLEIDISKHETLRSKGLSVVGLNFLQFKQGAIYSHIIMNPPFQSGVQHVLHAWNILYDGEIVAIINAETIKNPFSKERKFLVDLIDKHGSVEFLQDSFVESERTTEVEIALVYMRKESRVVEDIYGDILETLKKDNTEADELAGDYREINAVVLPLNFVESRVSAFNAAVIAAKAWIFAEQRAVYYSSILGQTMEKIDGHFGLNRQEALESITQKMHDSYGVLKNRAWTSILRSTSVTSKLSSAAQKRLEKNFEVIKHLEFNVSNIYGFLAGLSEQQGSIQIEMACDVFDIITRYYTDNTVFYMGWKSNDKHRTCGRSIKASRFILPNNSYYSTSLDWDARQRLADIDKVFAMMEGKREPEVSMDSLFENNFQRLKNGERLSSTYFDVRFYPGIKTIHFFPKDKKLVDRLNRLVGKQRAWIPHDDEKVNEAFWVQFKDAEKYDKEFRTELRGTHSSRFDDPLWGINSSDHHEHHIASARAVKALGTVLERRGINVDAILSKQETLLLEAS